MSKFAVFDIDGTLIRWQLYHAVSDALVRLGSFDETQFEPVRTARKQWKQRKHEESYMEYEHRLVQVFNTLLTGLSAKAFEEAADVVFDEYKDQVYRYTRDLIVELKQQGYFLLAVSGSPTTLVKRVADYYGFDDFVGSEFEIKDGKFTGERQTPFGKKHLVIQEMAQKHGLDFTDSIAVGDSEGDISMLEITQNPIAFNPSKKLLETAKSNRWTVVVERKNVIYQLKPVSAGDYKLV